MPAGGIGVRFLAVGEGHTVFCGGNGGAGDCAGHVDGVGDASGVCRPGNCAGGGVGAVGNSDRGDCKTVAVYLCRPGHCELPAGQAGGVDDGSVGGPVGGDHCGCVEDHPVYGVADFSGAANDSPGRV